MAYKIYHFHLAFVFIIPVESSTSNSILSRFVVQISFGICHFFHKQFELLVTGIDSQPQPYIHLRRDDSFNHLNINMPKSYTRSSVIAVF